MKKNKEVILVLETEKGIVMASEAFMGKDANKKAEKKFLKVAKENAPIGSKLGPDEESVILEDGYYGYGNWAVQLHHTFMN